MKEMNSGDKLVKREIMSGVFILKLTKLGSQSKYTVGRGYLYKSITVFTNKKVKILAPHPVKDFLFVPLMVVQ